MLKDEDGYYGIVMTDICKARFLKLLKQYKNIDILYNGPSFIDFLNNKDIKAELINPLEVYF
jgi:hypothetical protein